MMVHRTLAMVLSGQKITEDPLKIEEKAVHASSREVDAADAERASVKLKQVEYFSKLIGQKREGVISGVTEWGVYIEDKETGARAWHGSHALRRHLRARPKKFAVIGKATKRCSASATRCPTPSSARTSICA